MASAGGLCGVGGSALEEDEGSDKHWAPSLEPKMPPTLHGASGARSVAPFFMIPPAASRCSEPEDAAHQ